MHSIFGKITYNLGLSALLQARFGYLQFWVITMERHFRKVLCGLFFGPKYYIIHIYQSSYKVRFGMCNFWLSLVKEISERFYAGLFMQNITLPRSIRLPTSQVWLSVMSTHWKERDFRLWTRLRRMY